MPTRYRLLFILLAITLLSYFSVDILYKVADAKLTRVKTEGMFDDKAAVHKVSRKPSLDSYKVISNRNLFGSIDKASVEKQINVDELEPTKLKLALLGTVAGNEKFGFAVIEETDKKKQGLFRVGDTVATATVIKIMRGIVALRVGNRDEILKMKEGNLDKKGGGKEVSTPESTIKIEKADIDHAFENMNKILTQARIRPHFSSGKPDGFIISRIKKGSIFHKMGLKSGDVVQGVNDRPMESVDDMLELYKEMKSGSEVILNIKRRGKPESMKYVFK